jgi:hypothetical protein
MIALVQALLSTCGRARYETHPPAPPDPKVTGINSMTVPLSFFPSSPYSVVLPSKCSLSASASSRVWWTTPSR